MDQFKRSWKNHFDHFSRRIQVKALADAEWSARSSCKGTIPIAEFSQLATKLFVEALGGPGAKAPHTAGSTPYYVVTPEKLNGARLFYRRHAQQIVFSELPEEVDNLNALTSALESVRTAYPMESFLALYACISEDFGMSEGSVAGLRGALGGQLPASPARKPYGEKGYAISRPVSKLMASEVLAQLMALGR